MEEKYFSVRSLAVELGITEQTIRRYILARKIPYHKVARKVRFIQSEILEWVKNDMKMPLPSMKGKSEGCV